MNKSVMKCCICNNENIGEFITINDKKYHLCCIEQLQQENQKYKEVFDKAIEYIKENDELLYIKYWDTTCDGEFYDWYVESDFAKKLLDILKEVE